MGYGRKGTMHEKDGGWQKLKGEITDEIYKFTWKDVLITLGILLTATIVALVYYRISASNINVIMFYTLALLFYIQEADQRIPARIAAAMISVVCVNFSHIPGADQFHSGRLSGNIYMHAGGIGADQRLGLSYEAAVPDSCGSGKRSWGSGKGEDAGQSAQGGVP